jgi:hypothetical protein
MPMLPRLLCSYCICCLQPVQKGETSLLKLTGHRYVNNKKITFDLLVEQKADINAADKVPALKKLRTRKPYLNFKQSLWRNVLYLYMQAVLLLYSPCNSLSFAACGSSVGRASCGLQVKQTKRL